MIVFFRFVIGVLVAEKIWENCWNLAGFFSKERLHGGASSLLRKSIFFLKRNKTMVLSYTHSEIPNYKLNVTCGLNFLNRSFIQKIIYLKISFSPLQSRVNFKMFTRINKKCDNLPNLIYFEVDFAWPWTCLTLKS